MKTVNTATGSISAAELGLTLMHEHLFTLYSDYRAEHPLDEHVAVDRAVRQMKELRTRGVQTLVDMTVYGLGRNVNRVRLVSEKSGMQVIVATGVFTIHTLPDFFLLGQLLERPTFIEDFLVEEIETGIGGTGVKAAVLKCATDRYGVSKDVETVLRSTARAHRRTGVPIATHTHMKSGQGLVQQKIFAGEGVDLSRVIIGHVGDSTDMDTIEALLSRGSFIGMDRFGMNNLCSLTDRVATVAKLCKSGYSKQIVISHDIDSIADGLSHERIRNIPVPGIEAGRQYTYISDVVLPALLASGISQNDIDTMMIENPRRIFEQTDPY